MGGSANKQPLTENGSDAPVPADNVMIAARAAAEKKATDTVVLDLREIASFTEYFVICTGASTRQVQAISNSVEEELRKAGRRPSHIEGYSSAEWILLDYGDFIVHVFSAASRRFYDLERLWRDAKRAELPAEASRER
ncbi:MAG TPA: ribosome silencing factor [Blastocatellia bacterium]|jgi:ribosome-associated protein|nr:ribosome silencing factor [Blastocatellia bacterium]